MTHQTRLPGRFNPYKAAAQPTETARQAKARYAAFCEKVKNTSPKLYQQHLRDEANSETERILHDAMLDDPAMIAFMDGVSAKLAARQANALSSELTLLDIEGNATKREVRNAYRRKARKLHPDVGGDAEAFKQLHAAYRKVLAAAKA